MNDKIINMGTIKGPEWIGKKVFLLRKIPNRTHEVIITEARGWDGITLQETRDQNSRTFIINQYGEQGDLAFEDVDIIESNY